MTAIDPELLTFEYRLRYRGAPGPEHDPADLPMRWEITISGGHDGEDVQVGTAAVCLVPKAGMINLAVADQAH